MALAHQRLVTADQLERLADDEQRYDLVRGELICMAPASRPHGRVAMRVGALLFAHVREHSLGEVYAAETGFRLTRNPDTVLAPDAAFVRAERLVGVEDEGFLPLAPDLAVEVVSPSDRPEQVKAKIAAYLAAGVSLLWVLDPRRRTVTVHRPDSGPRAFRSGDDLTGEDVLPDLRLHVVDLFP